LNKFVSNVGRVKVRKHQDVRPAGDPTVGCLLIGDFRDEGGIGLQFPV
jgi:hypothetical protein